MSSSVIQRSGSKHSLWLNTGRSAMLSLSENRGKVWGDVGLEAAEERRITLAKWQRCDWNLNPSLCAGVGEMHSGINALYQGAGIKPETSLWCPTGCRSTKPDDTVWCSLSHRQPKEKPRYPSLPRLSMETCTIIWRISKWLWHLSWELPVRI